MYRLLLRSHNSIECCLVGLIDHDNVHVFLAVIGGDGNSLLFSSLEGRVTLLDCHVVALAIHCIADDYLLSWGGDRLVIGGHDVGGLGSVGGLRLKVAHKSLSERGSSVSIIDWDDLNLALIGAVFDNVDLDGDFDQLASAGQLVAHSDCLQLWLLYDRLHVGLKAARAHVGVFGGVVDNDDLLRNDGAVVLSEGDHGNDAVFWRVCVDVEIGRKFNDLADLSVGIAHSDLLCLNNWYHSWLDGRTQHRLAGVVLLKERLVLRKGPDEALELGRGTTKGTNLTFDVLVWTIGDA